jgi:GT2 family glycosyltransferase
VENQLDVSVIIVNWNTKDLLRDCIASIYEQAGEVAYEVIVVDNDSIDGSVDMVKSSFPDVILVENSENKGYAAGSNLGIRKARGRYVLILNSDTIICDAAIEKTVRYADAHPEAAVVGCQVRESAEEIQMTSFRFPSLLNLFLRVSGLAKAFSNNHFFGREHMLWWQRNSEREVDVISGMFMLVRRDAISEVGQLDEDYFLYFEETDWCYRFAKAGWKRLFWPGAKIIHLDGGGKSIGSRNLKLRIQMQKSHLLFFRKHYGVFKYVFARILLSLYFGLLWVTHTAKIFCKTIFGHRNLSERHENLQRWCIFKYCVSGREQETYSGFRKSCIGS